MRQYDSSGFVALAIPFFSDTYLPAEEGEVGTITDYKLSYVTTENGRTPRFYCVRVSHNGRHLKQLCDPGTNGDGIEPYTGAVRATVEEWWNDLKRGHFLDANTRIMTTTLQLKSNNMGIRYRITLMLEITSLGAILPSFDVETRLLVDYNESNMTAYAAGALVLVIFFCIMEGIEVVSAGAIGYFSDMWNVMDWCCYLCYFVLFGQIQTTSRLFGQHDCSSYLCSQVPRPTPLPIPPP